MIFSLGMSLFSCSEQVNKPLKYKVYHGNFCDCVIIVRMYHFFFIKLLIVRMYHFKDLTTCLVCGYFHMESQIEF